MEGWARLGDKHSQYKPIVSLTAQTVKINGIPAAMQGSKYLDGASVAQGSSTVFVEGKPAAYKTCKTTNGNTQIQASSDVYIGI